MSKKIILLFLILILGNLSIGIVQSLAGDKNLNDISNYLKKAGYKEAKVELSQVGLGEFTKTVYEGEEMICLIDKNGTVVIGLFDIPSVGKTFQFLSPKTDVNVKMPENASGGEVTGYWLKIGMLLILSSNDAVGKLMWSYDSGNANYIGMLPAAELSEKSFTSYLNMFLTALNKYANLKDDLAELEKKGAEGFSDAMKKEKKVW